MESPFAFVGSFVCRWNLPSPSVSWTRHRRLPVGGPVCFYFGRKLLNSFCWFLISEYIALQVNLFPVLCILARYSMVKMVFFSSHARIVDKVNEPFSVCAFCCWESRDQFARTSSTQMGQGSVHGATANSNDCGRPFFDELHVFSFPWWIPIPCFDSAVKGVAVAPALSAEWPRSFTCYFSDSGVERTSKKESLEEAKSGAENPPAASGVDRTCDLPITSPALYHWAIFKPSTAEQRT